MGRTNNPTRDCHQTDEDVVEALKILLRRAPTSIAGLPTARPSLHAAALKGRNATLRSLAANDVDPEPKDNNGKTPVG